MKRYLLPLLVLAALTVSCGYHLGGLRRASMKGMNTYCVENFFNETFYPHLGEMVTTAVADSIQRDGTYRMASADKCDFKVSGVVQSVTADGLRTDAGDTYLSSEIGLTVHVLCTVTNCRTGRVIFTRSVQAEGSYFNDSTGNVQSARDSALSYASRKVAGLIVQSLTLP